MLDKDQNYVALFIDWDNLVISTAADFGGASPDLRRIVQKAQQYGTVLLAKAYAEWQSTTDKLNVYRVGVEPVYAPTFRFESEATTKGKSLADPCMVADIVDSLHIFSTISTYILVTGDKDLIPVVRLAQLRGKKVVVIGPDFVAGVLRDMADDFVSYRKMIEGEAPRVSSEPIRRHSTPSLATTQLMEHSQGDSSALQRSAQSRSLGTSASLETIATRSSARRGRVDQRARETERIGTPAHKAVGQEGALAVEVASELLATKAQAVAEKPSAPDLNAVFEAITSLLAQRAEEGKPRVRATNLKDALMQKIGGFSERRYGFSKFKDLLAAAEANGLVKIRVAGPVHWVSLPDRPDENGEQGVEPVVATAEEPISFGDDEPKIEDMVRFIQDLRERSRWLTYTYLLTNMISHFAKTLPQNLAETKARSTLNWLVQEEVLSIDKEPQEVDVAGAKHRVRMCHLEDNHPQVAVVLEALSRENAEASEMVEAETVVESSTDERQVEASASDEVSTEPEAEPAEAEMAVEVSEEATGESIEAVETDALTDTVSVEPEVSSVVVPEAEIAFFASQPAVVAEVVHEVQPSDEAELAPVVEVSESSNGDIVADAEVVEAAVSSEPEEDGHVEESVSREHVFALLSTLVKENTGPKRPRMGAAGLKTKLVKSLGVFDERAFGFSRFKDFLKEAESQGLIHLETSGQITWVVPVSQEA